MRREGSRSRGRVRAGVALGAGLATLAQPLPAGAHDVGSHANLHAGGGTCLEGRVHFEEGHKRTTGYGGHVYAKSESVAGVSVFGVWLCPGLPRVGLPRGHLYARYELFIHHSGQWWRCLNSLAYSTSNNQATLTHGTDTGNKAPCVSANDRRGYWFSARSHNYYFVNGAWQGGHLNSGIHVLHNP